MYALPQDHAHADDVRALHTRGYNLRVHVPPPASLARYIGTHRSPLPALRGWLDEGLIDSVSGDDVTFLARLLDGASE